MTPFAETGPRLIAQGYSALPLMPGQKVPGRYVGGVWRHMTGWSRFCEALPDPFQVKLWKSWPEAGVGVACGRGVIGFDIDSDELVDPIKAVLPIAVVGKRGRKGETLFFRGDTGRIRSRGFKIDGRGVMDLIADGKQTVVPGSIHPNTGLPYEWTTARTLLDTTPAELTEVTEAHVDAVIEVLKGYGYQPEAQSGPWNEGVVVESTSAASDFFRRLNEDALTNLDAWVPRLGFARLARGGGGYRTVAEWRPSNSGNPLHKRPMLLSLNPKGIVDYGDGDQTYTALNVVMKMHDLADWQLDQAAKWLGETIGYDFTPQIILTQRPRQDVPAPVAEIVTAPIAAPEIEKPAADEPPAEEAEDVEEPEEDLEPVAARTREFDRLASNLPGVLGMLVEWMTASAPSPSRILALGAALTAMGAIAGRNYTGPTGLYPNLYTLGLAPSGFGKDHARDCVKSLFATAGLMRFLGGAKIMSGSAIRAKLMAQPSCLWMLDEFGGFVAEIGDRRAGPHVAQIRTYLLELYSTAKSVFMGADYAGEQGTPIFNPVACVYGTSTPSDFWGSMQSRAIVDGFLPRFIVLPVGGDAPEGVDPTASVHEPPRPAIEAFRAMAKPRGGNLAGVTSDGSTKVTPLAVPYGPGAKDDFRTLQNYCKAESSRAPEEAKAIWNRVAENAIKLAMVYEIGRNTESPVLGSESLRWGAELALLSARATIEEIAGRVADNDRQREHLDIKRWIAEAGASGVTRTAIIKKVNGRFNVKRVDEILQQLADGEKSIAHRLRSTGGRPSARWVLARYIGGEEADQ